MNETREFETTPFWRFIGPAALLHVLLIGVASLVPVNHKAAPRRTPAASASDAEVEVDLHVVAALAETTRPHARRATLGGRAPGRRDLRVAALARRMRATRRHGSEQSTEPGGEDGADTVEVHDGPERAASLPNGAGQGRERGPTLSLEQLGVGIGGTHAAVTPYRSPPDLRPSARRRLQRSMASALEERDRAHGLGAHGKVIQALEVASRTENTPPNGRASFMIVVDDRGRVANIEVLGVTGEYRAWKRAAQQARRTLTHHRVPLPEGAQGLQIQLEIASRVQRPSGHDPDIAVNLFGIPLNDTKGKRPSKIEVLNPIPKLQWVEVPDPATGETHELPVVQIMLVPLLLGFDPADLGAPTRRVVSGHVVDVNVL